MLKISIILIIFLGLNNAFGQDTRVQEPIKNFDHLWNVLNDRYAFFDHRNVNWDSMYLKYRPLLNENTINDSLFSLCNQMLLELNDGHVSLVQVDGKKIIRRSDDARQYVLIEKFPITKDSEPNIFQLIGLTKSTLNQNGFSTFSKSKSEVLQISKSEDYGYLLIRAMEGFKSVYKTSGAIGK